MQQPDVQSPDFVSAKIRDLGEWFHNMRLNGVQTAPNHFLGDYPAVKWEHLRHALPQDLSGKTVLDIGCNGGFYAIEMKRRGAALVVAIDSDDRYLAQARFAAEVNELEIEFQRMSVYDVGSLGMRFDWVLFMGVLYHLRHPLLALDRIAEHVADDWLVFQSLLRGSRQTQTFKSDYPFTEEAQFSRSEYPVLHFIEYSYSQDPTNWWIPNRSCAEAMLRSAGFTVVGAPEEEIMVCRAAFSFETAGRISDPVKGE